jgi:hypothetical protein
MKKLICILVSVFVVGCGSRKVHIEEYKSGAVIEKVSESKNESQSEKKNEVLTNIVNQTESNGFEIIADEIVIEDNQGNTATLKNAVISNKKSKSDANIENTEKVTETSQTKATAKANEVSKFEQSEKVRDTDRKQFNFTLLIIQISVALAVLAVVYWLYKRSI